MQIRRILTSVSLLALSALAQQSVTPDDFHRNSHQWQELSWKQRIRRRRLSPALKADLIETIVEQMREDNSDDEPRRDAQLRQVARETRIEFVDLAGHGRKEVIAQAGGANSDCSPTGNCPLWVLRRQADGFHVILSASSEQTFTIQTTQTNGLHDLVLGMHGSAFESELRLYKFDGSRYKQRGCYEASWQVIDEHGNAQHLKEPRISACD